MVSRVPNSEPLELKHSDLVRMGIPERYWNARLDLIPVSVRPKFNKLLHKERLHKCMTEGFGLILSGNSCVGKSSAAVVLLKVARMWGYPGYFITPSTLRRAVFSDRAFDEDFTVLERCRSVDLLVLDDFRVADLEAKGFGVAEFVNLLKHRIDARLSTILSISENIYEAESPTYVGKQFMALIRPIRAFFTDLLIEGPSQEGVIQARQGSLLFGDAEE